MTRLAFVLELWMWYETEKGNMRCWLVKEGVWELQRFDYNKKLTDGYIWRSYHDKFDKINDLFNEGRTGGRIKDWKRRNHSNHHTSRHGHWTGHERIIITKANMKWNQEANKKDEAVSGCPISIQFIIKIANHKMWLNRVDFPLS